MKGRRRPVRPQETLPTMLFPNIAVTTVIELTFVISMMAPDVTVGTVKTPDARTPDVMIMSDLWIITNVETVPVVVHPSNSTKRWQMGNLTKTHLLTANRAGRKTNNLQRQALFRSTSPQYISMKKALQMSRTLLTRKE